MHYVALRKESVDRNLWWGVRKAVGSLVALRKESVDRNRSWMHWPTKHRLSLSARRAWIEMHFIILYFLDLSSLSARRAWIEIRKELNLAAFKGLSLSARRAWIEISCTC